ncbi:MAG: SusC/RagA family TonB-linked outer membrane protein, partial [Tannerella sp.]|nr:SusC/RagA family TonB-linked outer membrane protein [Tannerella sp.]
MIKLILNPDAKEENYWKKFARTATVAVCLSLLLFQSYANHLNLPNENKNGIEGVSITAGVQQQTKSISGIVMDSNNEPVIGANVVVRGTTNGSITSVDGRFTLQNVPENAMIVVTFIGYIEQQISVQGRNSFEIILREDTQSLEEVVVVGYGVQKKANLTGSVSTVKYDQALENRPITNSSQALSGKITGVWASQNSGRPGDDGATIRIRGFGTMNNADPMVLVDGVEGRFNDVNPGDIASITVLKDAASAAIYGSRAANGVILIETKKGSDGQISINYNGYIGWQQLGNRYDIVTNSAEYMTLWNQAFRNQGSDPLFPQDVIDGFRNGKDPYRYPSTNYFDEVFRKALTTQHNVSATFGSNRSTTFMSLSYMKQDGMYLNTDADRFTLTINNEIKANNWLRFGLRARLMRGRDVQPFGRVIDSADGDGVVNGIGGAVYMMAVGHPFTTPYLQDGKTYGGTQALYVSGPRAGQPIVDTRNPFPDIYNGKNEALTNFMRGNAYAIVDIMQGLSLTIQYNAQATTTVRDRWNQLALCYTDLNGSNPTKPLDYPSVLHRMRYNADTYYDTFFANL